jgi:hypothetical protein
MKNLQKVSSKRQTIPNNDKHFNCFRALLLIGRLFAIVKMYYYASVPSKKRPHHAGKLHDSMGCLRPASFPTCANILCAMTPGFRMFRLFKCFCRVAHVGSVTCDVTHEECSVAHVECGVTHVECDTTHEECSVAHVECGVTHVECDTTHVECGVAHVGSVT